MKVVNKKLEETQKQYNSEKTKLEQKHKKEQEDLVDSHVQAILTKIL